MKTAETITVGRRLETVVTAGLIRSEVGKQTGVRFTPSLAFVPDALPDSTRHLDELLRETAERDAELQRAAAGAKPAGDPEPYRVPRAEREDDEE